MTAATAPGAGSALVIKQRGQSDDYYLMQGGVQVDPLAAAPVSGLGGLRAKGQEDNRSSSKVSESMD